MNVMNQEHPRQLSRGHGFVCLALFVGCALYVRTFGVGIRLVAVPWGERSRVFLFPTDTTRISGCARAMNVMTPEAIVRAYCARFAIETGCRDAKQSFGLSAYPVRNETGLLRLVHLCLWAQTLRRWVCWQEQPQVVYGDWRKPLGYWTLAQQKRLSQQACRVSAGSYTDALSAQFQGAEALAA